MRYVCVLDFESTTWDYTPAHPRDDSKREIIEFPSILFRVRDHRRMSEKLEKLGEFRKYVRPTINPKLTTICTSLTGITQDVVDTAETFPVVYEQHYTWLKSHIPEADLDNLVFITCGDWDLKTMLPHELRRHQGLKYHPCYRSYANLKVLYSWFYGRKPAGMEIMLKDLKMTLDGHHHSGLNDCRNLAKILNRLFEDGFKYNDLFY